MSAGSFLGLLIVLMPVSAITNSFVAMKLWEWFIAVPPLNAPLMTIHTAFGAVALVRFITVRLDGKQETTDEERTTAAGRALAYTFVFPTITLLFCFIGHKLLG